MLFFISNRKKIDFQNFFSTIIFYGAYLDIRFRILQTFLKLVHANFEILKNCFEILSFISNSKKIDFQNFFPPLYPMEYILILGLGFCKQF